MQKIAEDFNDDIDIKEKMRRLTAKFNITANAVTLEDILAIMDKIQLDKSYSKETAQRIFKELDTNDTGYVETEVFLNYICRRKSLSLQDDEFGLFYEKINQELVTKSEIMITKLKKIREKAWLANDGESLDDIDWIISSLHEENIFEPEYSEINKHLTCKTVNGIEHLMQYSQIANTQRKENDIQALQYNKINNMGLKTSIFFNSSVYKEPSEKQQVGKDGNKRKSTTLSTLISPSIIARLSCLMSTIDSFEYNIFELDELMEKKSAFYMAHEIFSRVDLIESETEIIEMPKFNSFLNEIVDNYDRKVPYHNDLHAADVMQTVFVMISQCDLQNRMCLNPLDIFAILLSALCHDFKHTGQNNTFHINSHSSIAVRYNDASVLENYHLAQTFKVLLKPQNNIMQNFTPEEFRICRRRMIEGILATDMANHQKHLGSLKSKIETYEIKNGNNLEKMFNEGNLSKVFENQQCVLNMCLHTADISNPAKPPKISETWSEKVYIEFFNQGDIEKKKDLPVSLLCDRETTNITKATIGFISFVVSPTLECLMHILPELSVYNDYMKGNLKRAEAMLKREEEKKK